IARGAGDTSSARELRRQRDAVADLGEPTDERRAASPSWTQVHSEKKNCSALGSQILWRRRALKPARYSPTIRLKPRAASASSSVPCSPSRPAEDDRRLVGLAACRERRDRR